MVEFLSGSLSGMVLLGIALKIESDHNKRKETPVIKKDDKVFIKWDNMCELHSGVVLAVTERGYVVMSDSTGRVYTLKPSNVLPRLDAKV